MLTTQKKRAGALFAYLSHYRPMVFISSVAAEKRSPSGAAICFAAEELIAVILIARCAQPSKACFANDVCFSTSSVSDFAVEISCAAADPVLGGPLGVSRDLSADAP